MTPAGKHLSRRAGLPVVAMTAALLSGCVTLPSGGPVEETEVSGRRVDNDAININPLGPQPGQSAGEIVKGWLDAMQATPTRTSVAREFVAEAARDEWDPAATITYTVATVPRAGGQGQVTLALSGAAQLDPRGAWQGPLDATEANRSIPMTQEDGEWRIADPPDALIVPESWFEQRFRQVSLYFFEPTARVLVPHPVFVPRGKQLASALVNGLLAGPAPEIADYAVNAVPVDLRAVVSVPVTPTGVAELELASETADVPMPTSQEAELMVAQLAWTLRQDPSIERLRVSIDGEPVGLPGGATEFSVEEGAEFAPYVAGTSTLLYGLRDGFMVAGSAQNLDPVTGPFGTVRFGVRTISADLRADTVGAVTADGSSLLIGPVRDDGRPVTEVVSDATHLLEPAWDFAGRLWFVDRRGEGARIGYVQDAIVNPVDVPGVSRRDVRHLLVSRDGSRLVAVVRNRDDEDAIVVSRLLSNRKGQVLEALDAVRVSEPDGRGVRIRDIAWRSPTSIAVLNAVSKQLFQVRSATVDGAPTGLASLSVTLDGKVLGLAGTPMTEESVYALTPGGLIDLAGSMAGTIEIDPNVSSLDYVG